MVILKAKFSSYHCLFLGVLITFPIKLASSALAIHIQSQVSFVVSNSYERNMDSPQHTRDQAAVKTVGFSGRIGAKEGQDGFVSQ